MAEQDGHVGDGPQDDASGAPDSNSKDDQSDESKQFSDSYRRKLLGQLKKTNEMNASLKSELDELKAAQRKVEEKKLNEDGEWKKLVEIRQKELDETKKRLAESEEMIGSYEQEISNTWKLQAFHEKLPGKIKKSEYLGFVDLDSIVIDPETREIDQNSVADVVNTFVDEHASLIDRGKGPKLPGDSPSSSGVGLSREEWLKLPPDQMRKRAVELRRG